jgi:hypothetical protein
MSIFTKKGWWISFNTFIDEETGEEFDVTPWSRSDKEYTNRLPIHCFLQMEQTTIITIKNLVEIYDE